MAIRYSKIFLLKVLHLYGTHPEQLTPQEQELAARICSCSICDAIWMRRKKRLPARCPECHKHSWNRPLLEAIRVQEEHAAAVRAAEPKEKS